MNIDHNASYPLHTNTLNSLSHSTQRISTSRTSNKNKKTKKRVLSETDTDSNSPTTPHQSPRKKRRRNEPPSNTTNTNESNAMMSDISENNDDIYDDISYENSILSQQQVEQLQQGDVVDHKVTHGDNRGKYMSCIIKSKRGGELTVKYIENDVCHISDIYNDNEYRAFAKFESISERQQHRFFNLQIGGSVYLNMKKTFPNYRILKNLSWIKCEVKAKDNGHILLHFEWDGREVSIWVHIDNTDIITDDPAYAKRQMNGYISKQVKEHVLERQTVNNIIICGCGCGKPLDMAATRFCISNGGTNALKNIQALRLKCHYIKTKYVDHGIIVDNVEKQDNVVKSKLEWTANDCAKWIGKFPNQYTRYKNLFIDEGINGMLLDELNYDDLGEFIQKKLHVKKILFEWKRLP
eukprot:384998_1